MNKILISTSVVTLLFTGCASIVSKSTYPVSFISNPPGATFTVKRADGVAISTGVTPATIPLNASRGYFTPARYTIEFERKGQKQTIPINAGLDGWYVGNLLFGGIVGFLIIDPATGAMWRLDDTVTATFNQSAALPARTLRIATLDQIPMNQRQRLVAVR